MRILSKFLFVNCLSLNTQSTIVFSLHKNNLLGTCKNPTYSIKYHGTRFLSITK